MHIQSVSIKGYRNFHNSSITFHKGLNVIIGSNNSGKTNLLNAIRLIRHQEKLSFFDFNMNSLLESFQNGNYKREPINITLCFEIVHEINLVENPTDESLLKLSDFLRLTDDIVADDTAASFPINASVMMFYSIDTKLLGNYRQKAESIATFDEYVSLVKSYLHDYKWSFFNSSTMRSVEPSVAKGIFEIEYVQADRSDLLLKESSTDLYKIMLSKSPLDKDGIVASIQDLVGEQAATVFSEMSATIDRDYEKIGINKGNVQIKPVVEFKHNVDQFFSFGVTDTLGSFELPFENNGLGYNNLISIYLILLCRDCINPQIHSMVLLEEPEAHLHPAMQYKLFKYINDLQNSDKLRQQIFVTTHSSNITAVTNIESIIDLHYDRDIQPNNVDSINIANLFNADNATSKNHIRKFLDVTRSDMLFADSVVLVEGLTEKLLVPIFMHKEGLDVDDNHISVVEMGGKWIKHFLYLFAPQRKTKVLCLTDCDYSWIVSDGINTSPYTTHEATHVTELKSIAASNSCIKVSCQCNADDGATFEDQLMLDNWQNDEEIRKKLFQFVLPDVLIAFINVHALSLPAWQANINTIRQDTQENVLTILQPFYNEFISSNDEQEKAHWEALFFANLFKKYASSQKGNLALSILTDDALCVALNTPRYIKEGIEWLKN